MLPCSQKYGIPTEDFCSAAALRENEIEKGKRNHSFPVKPQRIVADVRAAMEPEDIVLADTGAAKMWMARLLPNLQT